MLTLASIAPTHLPFQPFASCHKRNTLKHTGMQMIVKCQLQIIASSFHFLLSLFVWVDFMMNR